MRQCWLTCASGAGGCWSSTMLRTPRTSSLMAARRRRACADHFPRTGLGRSRRYLVRRSDVSWPRPESDGNLAGKGRAGSREADADRLADGSATCSPAVARAAGFHGRAGMAAPASLSFLGTRARQLLGRGAPRTLPDIAGGGVHRTVDRRWLPQPGPGRLPNWPASARSWPPAPIPEELIYQPPPANYLAS